MAVETNADGVVVLTEDNFRSGTTADMVFVKAFAPWCGHCKRLEPIWVELARRFRDTPRVVIAELDCTLHPAVCQKEGVTGYPTLLVYHQGSRVRLGVEEDVGVFVESWLYQYQSPAPPPLDLQPINSFSPLNARFPSSPACVSLSR